MPWSGHILYWVRPSHNRNPKNVYKSLVDWWLSKVRNWPSFGAGFNMVSTNKWIDMENGSQPNCCSLIKWTSPQHSYFDGIHHPALRGPNVQLGIIRIAHFSDGILHTDGRTAGEWLYNLNQLASKPISCRVHHGRYRKHEASICMGAFQPKSYAMPLDDGKTRIHIVLGIERMGI